MEGNNGPIDRIRVGSVELSIWENQNNFGGTNKMVSMQKNYKTKEGEWKKTQSLRVNDIPKAILALNKAYEKIVLKE